MRITATLKDTQSRLLDSHSLFAGREQELARLNSFLQHHQSGYLFVTAGSGFGKTAMLANWVKSFPHDDTQVCYHFISRLYGKTAEEDFALRNLCQQLTAYHDLRGALPVNTSELRALYPYLLAIPASAGQKLVVVIDGLDEARDWVGPELFPPSLPEGVFVVFSAREIAEQDWLANLELPQGEVELIRLTTMDTAAIAQLFRVAGGDARRWADDAAFMDTVHQKSGGDPFYLRYVVEDVRDGKIKSLAELEQQPSKLKGYLDKWWQDVSQAVSENAISDLIGYLLVAKGRLSRDDLTDISQTDALTGAVFERAIKQLQRYVVGDEKDGYTFCHPRFRDYVAQERIKETEQRPYRQLLLDYCSRWREHNREYALAHYAAHLAEAGSTKDLLDLFSPEWLRAKWNCFGSYSTLIDDMNVAAAAALKEEPPKFAEISALSVARQTARELMLSFPVALLVAWVRLGETRRVLELLRALVAVEGRAAEALTAVAGELLVLKRAGRLSDDLVDPEKVSAYLLDGALGRLYQLRSSSEQLESLTAITVLLAGDTGLPTAERASLLDQAEAFAVTLGEPAVQAAALGLVATATATTESGKERARNFIEQARLLLARIEFAPDRLVAAAYLLPAIQLVDPAGVLPLVSSVIKSGDIFAHSSLDKVPLRTLLKKWTPANTPDKEETVLILDGLGQLCVQNDEPRGFEAGCVVNALCEAGLGTTAISLIDGLWQKSAIEGARAVCQATRALSLVDLDRTSHWLDLAQQFTDPSAHDMPINRDLFTGILARGFATIGNWELAISLLKTVGSIARVEDLCVCLTLTGEAFEPGQMGLTMLKLMELSKDLKTDEQARVYAVAAQQLISYDPEVARTCLNQAAGLCLAELPEGETDDLRKLLAIALHQAGDYEGAGNAITPMKWTFSAIGTYSTLIEITPPDLADPMTEYCQRIMQLLNAGADQPMFADAVDEALKVARHLSEKQPQLSWGLSDQILDLIPNLGSNNEEMMKCYAIDTATRVIFDAPNALPRFGQFIDMADHVLRSAESFSKYMVIKIYEQLEAVVRKSPSDALPLLEKAAALSNFYPALEDRIDLDSAYAIALAPIDIGRAIDLLRKQLPAIAELTLEPPGPAHLVRMMSEFTGRQSGPRYRQADAARGVGAAIIRLGSYSPEEAARLMEELLTTINTIQSPRDAAQALADFFENCSYSPPEFQDHLSAAYTAALKQAQMLAEPGLQEYVLAVAVESLCRCNRLDEARRAAGLLKGADSDSARDRIEMAAKRMDLGVLSPLEKAYVGVVNPDVSYAVLIDMKAGKGKVFLGEMAQTLTDDLVRWPRHALITDCIRLTIVPVIEVDGPASVASLIQRIENFDNIFLGAASSIAGQ